MSADPKKRVVVTGLGVMSGLGQELGEFWSNLVEGKTSIARVSHFDPSDYTCQIASQVGDFTPGDFFTNAKTAKSNDRFTHLAVAAARRAVGDAGLDLGKVDKSRMGVMVGSAFGGMATFEEQTLKLSAGGPKKVSPFTIPALLGNTASGIIGIELGAQGPNFGVTSACAVGSHAIGEALNALRRGDADVMVAGGSEAAVTPLSFAGFCAMKAMCTQFNDKPAEGSRPFDADRCGFVMGEGAGVLVLETLEHAEKRGAKIYAELAGYGASCDAYHITTPAPGGAGLARAIEAALRSGGINKEEVGYVNAHGTSTAYNDKFETLALKAVFGEEGAKKLKVSSTKGGTGHTLGAAGGIEAVIAVKALETGVIPPTINFKTADPECDLDYTFNKAATVPDLKVAISENLGFGGHNAALAFKKV
ncbi:hypothetical protein GUITHDRAFT_62997 [Guillardia theta CCMP2712]|uniref:3-oxoacyl-[acyl-carrier-protein] synthase n=1 Tax=Guillardia theta (strain CCMP2712) TaxID=905079 RepID=L1K1Y4_GUITC|nr:hypothetical protein GUITHDRAFT_62997 [Guillardia theta CCMP2712]EKX54826.1 hypothetical protein GUITHDRAFT_62997 [Guillardia theta CCMP2712]|eukprot:XP_005841806.1 hypothetical protein GUITHDRAFT_62997 [Guillardia theta CCMP2712]